MLRRTRRSAPERDELPEVEVEKRRGISLVWLIPAGRRRDRASGSPTPRCRSRGRTITITFDDAEGLEAGKTKVKYKDVEVGLVDERRDRARTCRTSSSPPAWSRTHGTYMNEGTRFWIVRPRVGAGGVSGLGTLLSRAPTSRSIPAKAEPAHELRRPRGAAADHLRRAGTPVRAARRRAAARSARGAPVYYRSIEVGQVLGYELAEDKQSLTVKVFVDAPHDQLVRPTAGSGTRAAFDVSRRRRRRRGRDRVAAGAARRRHRVRHAGRSTSRASRPPPARCSRCSTSFRAVTEAGFTEQDPLPGLLRRLGARPAARARRSSSAACGSAR